MSSHHTKPKSKSRNRVTYNPRTSELDNPELKYGDNQSKIIEKLISQVNKLESKVEELSSEVARLKKRTKGVGSISGRVAMLEADVATSNRTITGMRHEIETNTFDSHADEDLRDYMMIEKDKDAIDTMMSGHEIGSKIEDMKQRRRNHGMRT
jgi:hypothetical protein